MQHDDVIWQVLDKSFCSFKTHLAKEKTFCSNPYNIMNLCAKAYCPLANSRYATVREHDGKCFLYIKTVERAHSPKNLWEKIELPRSYTQSLAIITEEVKFLSKPVQHRIKQRLTKIHQYLIRMRKLRLKKNKPKIVALSRHIEKNDARREKKALKAARLEHAIEQELLARELSDEEEEEEELEEEEEEMPAELQREFVEWSDEEEEEFLKEDDDDDIEDMQPYDDDEEGEEEEEEEEDEDDDDDDDHDHHGGEEEDGPPSKRQRTSRTGKKDKHAHRDSRIKQLKASMFGGKRRRQRVEVEYEEEEEEPMRLRA
jgi:protein MAK16